MKKKSNTTFEAIEKLASLVVQTSGLTRWTDSPGKKKKISVQDITHFLFTLDTRFEANQSLPDDTTS